MFTDTTPPLPATITLDGTVAADAQFGLWLGARFAYRDALETYGDAERAEAHAMPYLNAANTIRAALGLGDPYTIDSCRT